MYWNVLKDHRNIQQVILTAVAATRRRPTLSPIVRRVLSRFCAPSYSPLSPSPLLTGIFFLAADDGIMIIVLWECALLNTNTRVSLQKTQMTPKFVFSLLVDNAALPRDSSLKEAEGENTSRLPFSFYT